MDVDNCLKLVEKYLRKLMKEQANDMGTSPERGLYIFI